MGTNYTSVIGQPGLLGFDGDLDDNKEEIKEKIRFSVNEIVIEYYNLFK
ncbi:hypothetical protein [Photobacterium iliopiscarium]|nr:hypothetical protein [Photobacterium iliopiscarium]MCD9486868.1 hypothetical protein [Photobacterium iliopiscarium]MCF2243057.1 hypothetical protein [Photobacterium iliopiscarium]